MVSASLATIKLLFDYGGSIELGQLLHYATRRTRSDRMKILNFIIIKRVLGINRLLHQHRPANYLSLESTGLATPLGMAAREGTLDIAQWIHIYMSLSQLVIPFPSVQTLILHSWMDSGFLSVCAAVRSSWYAQCSIHSSQYIVIIP